MLQQRSRWHLWQAHCDPSRLVFLDETGVNTKMARLYGRAQGGRRCLNAVPYGHWKSNTFIAALRYDHIEAPWMFEGAMNAVAFLTYLRKCLLPTLKHGDIVICDNLSSHKVAGVAEILAEAGTQSATCHPTAQTSTRSRCSSPSSKHSCAKPPPEPYKL